MSKKNMIGMDLLEWNALAGLSDPYNLELAKISAEVGVPKAFHIPLLEAEAAEKMSGKQKAQRLMDIKRSHRKLRRQGKGVEGSGSFHKLTQLVKQKTEDGDQIVYPYDVYLEAFLEDNGSSLYEFNMLMDHAIEHGDGELADELLAVEAQLDELIGGALANAAKAVGGAVKGAGKLAGKAAMAGGKALAKGAASGAKAAAKGAGNLAGQAVKGFKAGAAASGAAQKAAPAAAPAGGEAPAPTPAAPTPGAGAADKSAAPAAAPKAPAPQAQTAGGQGAGGAAPSQPGQDTGGQAAAKPAGKKKEPGALGMLARGIGKVAKGVASMPGGAVATAKRAAGGAKKFGAGVKAGFQGEEAEFFEEFLAESGITIEEYLMVVEHAFEIGDNEMIEAAYELDEVVLSWMRKKKEAKAAAEKERKDKIAKAYAVGRAAAADPDVRKRTQQGLDMTKDQRQAAQRRLQQGGKKYAQNPQPQRKAPRKINYGRPGEKAANEAMDHILSMAGYTDEYIEGRSAKSLEKKGKQYQGLTKSNKDDFISKQASKAGGKKLVGLVDDPKNELAPQLIRTLRRTRK